MSMKCILVSTSCEKLKEFINKNSGGSVDIIECMESVYPNKSTLSNKLIRANKFIYVISDESNINKDLEAISSLLDVPAFFRIEEFYIIGINNESNTNACNLFKIILKEKGIDEPFINLFDNTPTYEDVYNSFMGVVKDEDIISNIKKKVYLSTKLEGDSKKGYVPIEYSKRMEIDIPDNVSRYDKVKQSAINSETKRPITDSNPKPLPEIDVMISELNTKSLESNKFITIVTGREKSGVSSYTFEIVKSMKREMEFINLIDLSFGYGSSMMCRYKLNKDIYSQIKNKDLFTGTVYSSKGINILTIPNTSSKNSKTGFVKYALSVPNRLPCSKVVIDCPLDLLFDTIDICGTSIENIIICANNTKSELDKNLSIYKDLLNRGKKFKICLTNIIQPNIVDKQIGRLEYLEIDESIEILTPMTFNENTDLKYLWKGES